MCVEYLMAFLICFVALQVEDAVQRNTAEASYTARASTSQSRGHLQSATTELSVLKTL